MTTSAPAPPASVSSGTASASSPRMRRPRRLLGATSASPPATLRFATTRSWQADPRLALRPRPAGATSAEGPVSFNLTHSGAVGYLAIATCSVGIDVELHRPFDDLQPLIDNYCSPAEIAALAALAARLARGRLPRRLDAQGGGAEGLGHRHRRRAARCAPRRIGREAAPRLAGNRCPDWSETARVSGPAAADHRRATARCSASRPPAQPLAVRMAR